MFRALLVAVLFLLWPTRAAALDLAPPLGVGGYGSFLAPAPISGPTACHLRGTFLLRPSAADPTQQPAVAIGGQGALSCSLAGYAEAGVSLWGIWDSGTGAGPSGWGPATMWMRLGPFYPTSAREKGFLVAPFVEYDKRLVNLQAPADFYDGTSTYGLILGWHKDRVEVSASGAYQRGESPGAETYQGAQIGASIWIRTFDVLQLGGEALARVGCAPGEAGPACRAGLWWTVGLRLVERHGVAFGLAYGRGHMDAAPAQQGQMRLGFSIGPHLEPIMSGPSWLEDVVAGLQEYAAERRARALQEQAAAALAAQLAASLPPLQQPLPAGVFCDVGQVRAARPCVVAAWQMPRLSDVLQDAAWVAQQVGHAAVYGGAGLFCGLGNGFTPGGFLHCPDSWRKDGVFILGEGFGRVSAGMLQAVVGTSGHIIGAGLDATGIGAAVGVPAAVVSTVVLSNGALAMKNGGASLAKAISLALQRRGEEEVDAGTQPKPKGGTYKLTHPETEEVMRTGRTSNLGNREKQHAKHPSTKGLQFEIDVRTDDYATQRGREQVIHDQHKPPMNKINPISPKNPRRQEYMDAAKRLEQDNGHAAPAQDQLPRR